MSATLSTGARDALERVLDHVFDDPNLLRQAVTHRGAASAGDRHGYERLEFLGDRVLGLVMAETLYRDFPDEAEGKLAMRHAQLVRRETLAEVAVALGIDRLIVVAPGEEQSGTRESVSVLADVTEALIAALYLDGGGDVARAFVRRHWVPRMLAHRKPPRDAKSRLQEWAQGRGLPLPDYAMIGRTGPSHAPTITVRASVEGLGDVTVEGRSRQSAEQEAARYLLERAGVQAPAA
ncbi:MAG: ribonuclease III [Rhodospirillales bacterium]|nr:ribonuclease III [Rhodospirillales bacterium]